MASGTPVVVTDSGALRETVGGAGRVVPEADIVDAVLEARGDDGSAGIERAKNFSWARTAQAVDDLLSALVDAPPPGTPRTTGP
jgi:glycosyltransferase involved in cell wall biosynthesis